MGKHLGYIYCPECHFRGKPETYQSAGQIFIQILLFLMFIIPWVVYKFSATPKVQCPKCGNRNPKIMPGGQTYKCPFCGARVADFETNCPQCGRKMSAGEKYQKTRVEVKRQTHWKNRD